MVYLASGPIRKQRLLSLSLPNRLNVAFDYYVVCWIIVLAYVPGRFLMLELSGLDNSQQEYASINPCSPLHTSAAFPQLYGYMLAQRRKLLGGARRSKLGRKQA